MKDLTEAVLKKSTETKKVTVSRLVQDVSETLPCRTDSVIAELIRLEAEGRLHIEEPAPYRTLSQYIRSLASAWFWETTLVSALSLVLLLVSQGPLLYLRYVFGGLLVLMLPGFSLVSLLYPKKTQLDFPTRMVLSFVMSLSIVILVGLVLNYTAFGLSLVATALSLTVISEILLFLAVARRFGDYMLLKSGNHARKVSR